MNAGLLEEFRYTYGDPRPHLLHYVGKMPNVHIVLPQTKHPRVRINDSDCLHLHCINNKRHVLMPRNEKLFLSSLSNPRAPILLIPLVIKRKEACRISNDTNKHMIFFLYNTQTLEIDRIDIKKYHLSGFGQKLGIKRFQSEFLSVHLPDSQLSIEIDVSMSFMKKTKLVKASDAFPIYLLTYLHHRCNNPNLHSGEVLKLVDKTTLKDITQIWSSYMNYRISCPQHCSEGKIENAETRRCLLPLSKSLVRNAIEKAPKVCKGDKVYSPLLLKCVNRDKLADVNILLDEVMSVKLDSTKIMSHMDSDPAIIYGVMNFLMSKFPHAKFMYSLPDDIKKLKKADLKVKWVYSMDKDKFDFSLPNNFWSTWTEHMTNASCQFIISYVSLTSKPDNTGQGHHSNLLIYDKATNELERFDGLGRYIHDLYHVEDFDKVLIDEFDNHTHIFKKPIKYYTPMDFCPKMPVFQMKEINDIPGKDVRGNCAVWRIWYIHTRLANPHLNRKDLILMASRKLENIGSFYKFIKSYQLYLLSVIKKRKNSKTKSPIKNVPVLKKHK